jgi:hypothetical protein
LKKMSATVFVLGVTTAALVGAGALLAWTSRGGVLPAGWVVMGLLATAVPGVAGGAWLAHEHGRAGSRFVVALQAGILARLVLAAVVAMGAAQTGGTAISASMAGLAAGFVSVMVFEMAWFARAPRTRSVRTETRA